MSRPIFGDTFYWIALTDPTDAAHSRALAITSERIDSPIVTTDEVLGEYLTFFSGLSQRLRRKAVRNVQDILSDPGIRVHSQSHESFLAGLELYAARPDKRYSLTDCVSMQTMRREGLTDVLTNDHHFAQEGFRVLFSSGQ